MGLQRISRYVFLFALLGIIPSIYPAAGAEDDAATIETYPVRVLGYRLTVTVPAEFEEFSAYLMSDEIGAPKGVDTHLSQFYKYQGDPEALGKSVESNYRKGPASLPGRAILIKVDKNHIWFVWDNPLFFQVRRWEFSSNGSETKITGNIEIQVQRFKNNILLEDLSKGLSKRAFMEMDRGIARIQAKFEPSINEEELLALGLRGEMYDKLMQISEVRVKCKVSQKALEDYISHVKLEELASIPEEASCSFRDPVTYCASGGTGPEFFVIDDLQGGFNRKVYMLSNQNIGLNETKVKPRGLSSQLIIKWMLETPKEGDPASLDQMLFINQAGDMIKEEALGIKRAVER